MHKRVKNFKFIVANQDPTIEKALVEVKSDRGMDYALGIRCKRHQALGKFVEGSLFVFV